MKIPIKLLDRYREEYPASPEVIEKNLSLIKSAKAHVLDAEDQFRRGRDMIAAVSLEDVEDAFERYVGDNDLLPVNYLELGQLKSKSVGRIHYADEEEMKPAVATGFLISPDLVMTNHHVFSDPRRFSSPIIEFDYEYDIHGKEKAKVIFNLTPDKFFFSNEQLDLAIIGVSSKDVTGTVDIGQRGFLVLNEKRGKIGKGDFACIIQHPGGKPKQISLRENKVVDLDQEFFIV